MKDKIMDAIFAFISAFILLFGKIDVTKETVHQSRQQKLRQKNFKTMFRPSFTIIRMTST